MDGKEVARLIRAEVAASVNQMSVRPALATVLVGDDPASATYVLSKRRAISDAGIVDAHRHVSQDHNQGSVAAIIDELVLDDSVTGILLQLPLPDHLDSASLINRIPPHKDVDGLTEANAGRLLLGQHGLAPCTPAGVLALLDHYDIDLFGAEVVVIGRSNLVGRPLGQLLLRRHATVTMCHSRTRDLPRLCRRADVLITAAGVPGLVTASAVKVGATVIDVGINRTEHGLCGDVAFGEVMPRVHAITPVPGGVGPMTIAMLLRNTVTAAHESIRV
jgi:methylenetetrahydrofolate dehydrogenase (NADP+)/methenyltetrahydrofolate cyclohydrolase